MDLARIAPMPREQKRRELEKMKSGRPPHSYDPFRREILDILNVTPGPLAAGPRTPWSVVSAEICKRSKTAAEAVANLGVAEALYRYGVEHDVSGRGQEFFPLAIGVSEKISYWSPAVVGLMKAATVLFIDPRRFKKLSSDARRFVFSAMHERVRAADPDYAKVTLGIIQFGSLKVLVDGVENEYRTPKLFTDAGVILYSFDQLDEMVRETYELWREILEERDADARRRGTGTSGPLI